MCVSISLANSRQLSHNTNFYKQLLMTVKAPVSGSSCSWLVSSNRLVIFDYQLSVPATLSGGQLGVKAMQPSVLVLCRSRLYFFNLLRARELAQFGDAVRLEAKYLTVCVLL